jgi:hypothetical protein
VISVSMRLVRRINHSVEDLARVCADPKNECCVPHPTCGGWREHRLRLLRPTGEPLVRAHIRAPPLELREHLQELTRSGGRKEWTITAKPIRALTPMSLG